MQNVQLISEAQQNQNMIWEHWIHKLNRIAWNMYTAGTSAANSHENTVVQAVSNNTVKGVCVSHACDQELGFQDMFCKSGRNQH